MKVLDYQDSAERIRAAILADDPGTFHNDGFDGRYFRQLYFDLNSMTNPDFAAAMEQAKQELQQGSGSVATNQIYLASLAHICTLANEKIKSYPSWLGLSFFDLVHECLLIIPSCIKNFNPDLITPDAWKSYLSRACFREMDHALSVARVQGFKVKTSDRRRLARLNTIIWKSTKVLNSQQLADLYNKTYPNNAPLTDKDIEFLQGITLYEWKRDSLINAFAASPSDDPAMVWERNLFVESVNTVLDEPYRSVFWLSRAGYSHADIGKFFNENRDWARSRLDTAFRRLKNSDLIQSFKPELVLILDLLE